MEKFTNVIFSFHPFSREFLKESKEVPGTARVLSFFKQNNICHFKLNASLIFLLFLDNSECNFPKFMSLFNL